MGWVLHVWHAQVNGAVLARISVWFLTVEYLRDAVHVHGLGPAANQDGCERVAGKVGQSASLGHKAVDAHDDVDAAEELRTVGLQARSQRCDAGSGDTRCALGRDDHKDQQAHLLAQVHRHMHCLGNEDGGKRQINSGAIQVEGITGRYNDTHGRLLHAEVFQLAHEVRQCGFRGRSSNDEQELAAQILAELPHADAAEYTGDEAEYHEYEEEAGDVESQHQGGQGLHGIHAGLTNDACHSTERAERSQPQNHVEDLEDEALQAGDEAKNRFACLAHGLHGEATQQCDKQDLENRSRGKRREHGLWDDGADKAPKTFAFRTCLDVLRAITAANMKASAGIDEVSDHEADRQRKGGHRDEVRQSDAAGLSDRCRSAHRADAQHDGAEDDWRDDHLDEADEHRAQWLEVNGNARGD